MYNPVSRTPISYYGGKQSLLSHILPLIPPHEVYTETFFGGGSVFFAKDKVKNETINDQLDIVINFYQVVKSNFKSLKKLIEATLISRTQHLQALSMIRNKKYFSAVQLAWAFWVCSNFSYGNKIGGGIKYSNHQSTVVPEALRNKKKRFTDWLVNRLEDAYIECGDAIKVLKSRNVSNAFHYIDPPYFNADMGHYGGYTENNLIDLLQTCETLTGRFLLSNYNSEVLDCYITKNGWYKKEVTHRLKAPRKSGVAKVEVLVSNYSTTCLIENKLFL